VAELRDRAAVRDVAVDDRTIRVRVNDPEAAAPEIARAVVRNGGDLLTLTAETASLESVYFDVLGIPPTSNGALA
jgi:hypothetical protein